MTVLGFREKKTYETIPRNIGGIRNFNRISVEGVNPNILEDELSKFEGRAATALRKLGEGAPFEGVIKDLILNLIAIFAVRSPEMREHWRQFHEQVAERVMDIALATRQRWESQVRQMKGRGIAIADDITYDDVKDFLDSKAYKTEVPSDPPKAWKVGGGATDIILLLAFGLLVGSRRRGAFALRRRTSGPGSPPGIR